MATPPDSDNESKKNQPTGVRAPLKRNLADPVTGRLLEKNRDALSHPAKSVSNQPATKTGDNSDKTAIGAAAPHPAREAPKGVTSNAQPASTPPPIPAAKPARAVTPPGKTDSQLTDKSSVKPQDNRTATSGTSAMSDESAKNGTGSTTTTSSVASASARSQNTRQERQAPAQTPDTRTQGIKTRATETRTATRATVSEPGRRPAMQTKQSNAPVTRQSRPRIESRDRYHERSAPASGYSREYSRPRRRMAPPPGTTNRNGAFIRRATSRPPLIVDPASTTRGSAWGPLLLGLLLLIGVGWFAVNHYTPQIEDDLTLRSMEALNQAGVAENANVSISGRSATLTGLVPTQEARNEAERVVANTFGVRAVDNNLQIGTPDSGDSLPTTQPSLEFSRSGESVTLAGTVSDARFATAIETQAGEQFGADNVTSSISVDPASTNPGWLPALTQLLPETNTIDNAGISITEGTLTLTGESGTAEGKESIGTRAEELLNGHLQVENLIEAPEPVVPKLPAFASIKRSGQQITLNGFMSAESASLIADSLNVPDATVVNNIAVNELADSPVWADRFAASADALDNVKAANLTVARSGNVTLMGVVDSEEIKADTEAKLANAFGSDYPVTNQLAIVPPPVVPTMTPFMSLSETDGTIRVSGLLPPQTADDVLQSLQGQGKTVIDSIAADERVMEPDWADSLPESLTALEGVSSPKVNVTSAGELVLRGVVESEDSRQSVESSLASLMGDSLTLRNDIVVEVPPVVPTMAPFASIVDSDDQLQVSGLLPPAAAQSIIDSFSSQGKTVVDNIAMDERVMEPAWGDQLPEVLTALDGVAGRKIYISSAGEATLKGVVPSEEVRQTAGNNLTALFGNSVSLRNDITVESPTIAEVANAQDLFDQIDLSAIRFKSNSSELDADSVEILEQVSSALDQVPDVNVTIGGHTDSTGNYDYNLNLSAQRAETVRAYLVDRGTNPDRLTAVGFGPSQPVASNETITGRALNRRIEITLSGE